MNEVNDFFGGLFSSSDWPARWNCGTWSSFHGWLYIVSDIVIWISYFMIPVIILNYLAKKKEKVRFQKAYLLFAAFILLCGTTHFLDAIMFWLPIYRVSALVRFATAVVSMATVLLLIRMLPTLTLQKTNIELENEIALRKEAERKLEELNQGLKTFAAIASHDLQEPLRKISMYSSFLEAHNKVNFDEQSRQYITKINQSSKSMQTLIMDVLTLSSLKNNIGFNTVDLNATINQALSNLELKILEKQAVIEVKPLPQIKGSKNYLAQLFYNLVNNALKFNLNRPHITIYAETTGPYTTVYVKDNGIGIDKTSHEKIFESLHRLNSKNEFEGNGLGLAICKRIADLHHAEINVSSAENEGSIFSIRFKNS